LVMEYKSILLNNINISSGLLKKLNDLGFTETGNFIDSDDIIFVRYLTKDEFVKLAMEITRYKAAIFYNIEKSKEDETLKNLPWACCGAKIPAGERCPVCGDTE